MDPPFRQYHGPPLPNEMDSCYGQDDGPFPPYITDQQPFMDNYNPTPTNEVDQVYRQGYGLNTITETPAQYGQEYGPPLPVVPDQPYGLQYYGPPPPDETNQHYWENNNGPPPQNEFILPYRQHYGPQNGMEPPYRRDYGPPPNEPEHPYRPDYASAQLIEMGSMNWQDYKPPTSNETYPQYKAGNTPANFREADLPYRQYYGYQQSNEMDPQFATHPAPPHSRNRNESGNNEHIPFKIRNIHSQYPPDPNTAKERSSSIGSELQTTPSSPLHTLEAALREVEVNLPRLAVLPSTGPARPKGGECGLPNLGQTCYLSAVLQCLYHTLPLTQYLISHTFKEDLVKGSPSRGQVARAAADVLMEMDRGKPKKGTLAYFKGLCGRMDERFAGSGQREAHDLLFSLLIWLHQDLANGKPVCACNKNSPKGHQKEQAKPGEGLSDQTSDIPSDYLQHNPSNYTETTNQSQSNMIPPRTSHHRTFNTNPGSSTSESRNICKKCGLKPEQRSVVSDIFEGMHRATIICPESGVIICSIHERFWSLSLPLNYPGETPLEDALQQYYRTRAVSRYCNYCGHEHLCHQQMRILFLPKVLILHLDRYTTKGTNPKLNRVSFPTEELTLDDHLTPGLKGRPRSKEFSLYSICNHQGNKKPGRYTACCKSNHPQLVQTPWLFFDDEEVLSIERFKNPREAHILFYTENVKEHQ